MKGVLSEEGSLSELGRTCDASGNERVMGVYRW